MDMIEAKCFALASQFFQAITECWKREVWRFNSGRWTAVHQANIALPEYQNTKSQISNCFDTTDCPVCAVLV